MAHTSSVSNWVSDGSASRWIAYSYLLAGSPFTYPTASHLPVPKAQNLKVLDHALNVVYSTPFDSLAWHNFAVQVDWDNRTLGVFYSKNGDKLKQVTKHVVPNLTAAAGDAGKGDFHFGVLKVA